MWRYEASPSGPIRGLITPEADETRRVTRLASSGRVASFGGRCFEETAQERGSCRAPLRAGNGSGTGVEVELLLQLSRLPADYAGQAVGRVQGHGHITWALSSVAY
ncbi:unnamed protein product [Boreogadus saida]